MVTRSDARPPVQSPWYKLGDILVKIALLSFCVSSAKNADKTIYIRTVLNLIDLVCYTYNNIFDYTIL